MIHELRPRVHVREDGAEAFRRKLPEDANPHWPPGTDAHLEWHAGYKAEQYKPAAHGSREKS